MPAHAVSRDMFEASMGMEARVRVGEDHWAAGGHANSISSLLPSQPLSLSTGEHFLSLLHQYPYNLCTKAGQFDVTGGREFWMHEWM